MSKVRIGLDQFHYAGIDAQGGYEEPTHVRNITEANFNPNSDVATFFADDGPADAYSQLGEVELEVTVADLPPEDYAYLIGADYDENTGLIEVRGTDSPPDVAVGFRSQKVNGKYRYMWFYRGKFGVPEEEFQTKQDSVEFQPQTITYRAVQNDDQAVFRRIDSDDSNADSDLVENWFKSPDYEPQNGGD